jgi:anti-sigma regulatory factor (Ser/Thr protein kinase)/predicted transcriptional regulator
MSLAKADREKIQMALLKQIDANALAVNDIAVKHQISRQTVYRYLRELVAQNIIRRNEQGDYALVSHTFKKNYDNISLNEDIIWRNDIAPFFAAIPRKAFDKAQYIFAEIMNNAIEHSESKDIQVALLKNQIALVMIIVDYGIGIFNKIQTTFNLPEKSFAILELLKGKLTTEPEKHTGEGIFFSSRIADNFYIFSDKLTFISDEAADDFFTNDQPISGTAVSAKIYFDNDTPINEVFRAFTEHPEHLCFSATHVPVRLLEYGSENPILVSRSEARRLLSRFESFSRITLDFAGVLDIRQGFADEVFRVFPNEHPDCIIETVNCNEQVQFMIAYVKRTK